MVVRGAMGNVTDITPNSLTLGTAISYARYHQTGTSRMPMRKIIELTKDQKYRWTYVMRMYLTGVAETIARMTKGGK
jgi:phage gpG-like protein